MFSALVDPVAACIAARQPGSLVYRVGPTGIARLMTRGAYATGAGEIKFDLYPQDYRIPKGWRIGVFISGSDTAAYTPHIFSPQSVTVSGGVSLSAVLHGIAMNSSSRPPPCSPGPSRTSIRR